MMRFTAAVTSALLIAAVSPGAADVVDKGPAGFTLRIEQRTAATPAAAYQAFVEGLALWWDGAHTYSGSSKNLSIEARPGGCFCEIFPAGGGVEHARVIYVEPGKLLRMQGALGPLQSSGVASVLTWTFEPVEGGAKITLTVATGGYLPGGFDKIAVLVDGVLKGQVARLAAYADKQVSAGR
jgi:uncharacterized protein YndB with AHSA1/START domain